MSLAATEVALDGQDWPTARLWLERADAVGGGPTVEALLSYIRGREALAAGNDEAALPHLTKAARMRASIAPFRRVDICLLAARSAAKIGKHEIAEEVLRPSMAEIENLDQEIEVAWRLGKALQAQGKLELALSLFSDISLRQPDSTYGRLAANRSAQLRFSLDHAETLTELAKEDKE